MLKPRINLEFISFRYEQKHVEIIVIDPAFISPVYFKSQSFVRVNSIQTNLREFPQRERAIWNITSRFCFEDAVALAHASAEEVLSAFSCDRLLVGMGISKNSHDSIVDQLSMEGLIVNDKQGGFDVSNLLAIAASIDMRRYETLKFKTPRVITYKGTNKLDGEDDVSGQLGYAIGFSRLLKFIMGKLPHKEVIEHGIRTKRYAYPEKAIREFLANALIHQDLTQSGSGPTIEIFSDRVKITSPGRPLISPDRFIDAPPKSRNVKLADLMRRMGLCESRGSGVDRALDAIEAENLPPPLIQEVEDNTIVTLYAEKSFALMTKDERLRACYQHASLKFESGQTMSNQSLRSRLGLGDKQYPQVSLVIRDALDAGLVCPLDEDQGNRNARYIPWWAK